MADGELIFDTKVDTDNFEKGVKDIKNKLNNINNSVDSISRGTRKAFDGMSSAQIGLVNSLDQTKRKMSELKAKIDEIEKAKIPTEQYKKVQDQVASLKKEYDDLTKQKKEWESLGISNKNSAAMRELEAKIKSVKSELQSTMGNASALENSGQAFKSQGPTQKSEALRTQYNAQEATFIKLNKQLAELNAKQNKASSLGTKFKNVLSGIGGAAQSFGSKISKAFKNSENPAKSFIKKLTSISTLLKARVISGLVSSIVKGVKSGFNNLVQYSSKVNASISGLKSSFTQLNNALATAFMPILQQIAPIIQSIINKIIEAINVVAQFTSRLFSSSTTFTRAKKINEDYAKSLSKTNKSQKKAFSFDTIEKIDSKKDDGSVDPSKMFEEANIEKGVLGFTDTIKNAISNGDWRGVGTLLAGKLNGIFDSVNFGAIGAKVGTKINNALNAVYGFLTGVNWQGIGEGVANFLNNAFQNIDFELIGRTLAQKIKVAVDLAYGFITTFDWSGFGTKISDIVNGWFYEIDWAKTAETLSLAVMGLLDTIGSFISDTDWRYIGNSVSTFLGNIEWSEIISKTFYAIGEALGATAWVIYGLLEDGIKNMTSYFRERIELCGGNIAEGLLYGIGEALVNIGKWLKNNIVDPLVNGIKNMLGIHSPSKVMSEIGHFIVEGLLGGISEKWNALKEKVSNLCSGLVSKVKNFFGIHSPSTVFADIGENITAGVEEGIGDGNGAFDGLNSLNAESVADMKEAWTGVGDWFKTNVTEPLSSVFQDFGDNLSIIFGDILSTVKTTTVLSIDAMNIMIDSLETAMDNVVRAVNKIISSINATSEETGIYLPYAKAEKFARIPMPKLATGTVVPANYGEFAAILGDNKREPEVVSPISTMKQALVEALQETGGQNITIKFEESSIGDLVRILKPYLEKENNRIGNSMRKSTGGAF